MGRRNSDGLSPGNSKKNQAPVLMSLEPLSFTTHSNQKVVWSGPCSKSWAQTLQKEVGQNKPKQDVYKHKCMHMYITYLCSKSKYISIPQFMWFLGQKKFHMLFLKSLSWISSDWGREYQGPTVSHKSLKKEECENMVSGCKP